MLLSGAGLLIKSFVALSNVTLGFRPEHVLLMKTSLPVSGPEGEAHARHFFKQLLSSISSVPGVSAAGATMGPPGDVESAGAYWIDHSPKPKEEAFTPQEAAVYSVVTPGTFAALGIPQDAETRRAYRDMIVTAPGLSDAIGGAILYDETIRQETKAGVPFADALKAQGIVPGVKVDEGAVDLPAHPNEKVTEGLDGLRGRLKEYYGMGARFAL